MWFAFFKSFCLSVCLCFSLYYAYNLITSDIDGWGYFIFIAFILATEMPSAERLYKTKNKVLDKEDED
jgi:hypothetical protein